MYNYQLPVTGDLRYQCSESGKRGGAQGYISLSLRDLRSQVCVDEMFERTLGTQHTGINAFACCVCGKDFSYSSTMKAHVKQFHADAVP